MKPYRWKFIELPSQELVEKLSQELSITTTLAKVLVYRNIDTFEKARTYFRASTEQLHNPFLLKGMEKAVERILSAKKNNEKILVYGDYDVDGTNGTSLLYLFFKKELGCNVHYYIPDRITEGYGITKTGIEYAHQNGFSLLVSVDCGITAVEQIEYANSFNINVVICDHHEPGEKIPNAIAVLNPLQKDCPYPFKYLCGCGVGFKLIQALSSQLGNETLAYSYLDFVAIASAADIVPLVDENRILVKLGLELINTQTRIGIKALLQSAGLQSKNISTNQIVFGIAPRINAVGRLGDAKRAVELLISENNDEAKFLAAVLEKENTERRKIDENVFLHAQEIIEQEKNKYQDALLLHHEEWHPGVIGIAASRLVEHHYLPTIMMTTVDGKIKGSARSISGFNIYNALKQCENTLLQFGGHKYAAGLTLSPERLEEFRETFSSIIKEQLTDELRTPQILIDAEIDLAELTPKTYRILKQFAPFGPHNMRPTFVARNIEVVGQPRIVGKDHLQMKVRKNNVTFDCIGFSMKHFFPHITKKNISIAFSVDENDFNGIQTPQLRLKDIKIEP